MAAQRAAAIALALLALAGLAAATPAPAPTGTPWYSTQYEKIGATWTEWGPTAVLAVSVAFLFVALAYMIGIGFDLHWLRVWAKSEFYQALASAILVGSLLLMTATIFDEGVGRILGEGVNPFTVALSYLDNLEVTLQNYYNIYYWCNFPTEALSSFSFYENVVGIDMPLFFFLKPLRVEPLHIANSYIVQSLVLLSMWREVILFFRDAAFATFLPLGVFLRIFPPTRGAGGLLIAIALAFFIVFPTMFAFLALMSEDETALSAQLIDIRDACTGITIDTSSFRCCDRDLDSVAQISEEQSDPSVIAEVNSGQAYLPGILLKLLFYPIVVMAVTVTFIRTLAPLLGSDISEIGQGLIRLI